MNRNRHCQIGILLFSGAVASATLRSGLPFVVYSLASLCAILLTSCARPDNGLSEPYNLGLQEKYLIKAERAFVSGQYAHSAEAYRQSAANCVSSAMGDQIRIAYCLLGEARSADKDGKRELSADLCTRSLALCTDLLARRQTESQLRDTLEIAAAAWCQQGDAAKRKGDWVSAESCFVQALEKYRKIGAIDELMKQQYAECLLSAAEVSIARGQTARASHLLLELSESQMLQAISTATRAEARDALQRCGLVSEGEQAKESELRNQWQDAMTKGKAAYKSKDYIGAIKCYTSCATIGRMLADYRLEAVAAAELASAYSFVNDLPSARRAYQRSIDLKLKAEKNPDLGVDRLTAGVIRHSFDRPLDEQLLALDDWLTLRKRLFGDHDSRCAQPLVIKAVLYDYNGLPVPSAVLEEALAIYLKGQARDDSDPVYLCSLGDLFLCRSDYKMARTLYLEGVSAYKRRRGKAVRVINALMIRLNCLDVIEHNKTKFNPTAALPGGYTGGSILSAAAIMRDLQAKGKTAEAKVFAQVLRAMLKVQASQDISDRSDPIAIKALALVEAGKTPDLVGICGKAVTWKMAGR